MFVNILRIENVKKYRGFLRILNFTRIGSHRLEPTPPPLFHIGSASAYVRSPRHYLTSSLTFLFQRN